MRLRLGRDAAFALARPWPSATAGDRGVVAGAARRGRDDRGDRGRPVPPGGPPPERIGDDDRGEGDAHQGDEDGLAEARSPRRVGTAIATPTVVEDERARARERARPMREVAAARASSIASGRRRGRRPRGTSRSRCARRSGTAGAASRRRATAGGATAAQRCSRAASSPPGAVGGQRDTGRRRRSPGSARRPGRRVVRGCVIETDRGHRARIARGSSRDWPDPMWSGAPRKRKNPGDDLFSRKAALSVSSALESLTSVFGMGTGVASPLESPGSLASGRFGSGSTRGRDGPAGAGMRSSISSSRQGSDHDPQPLTPGQLLKRSSPRPLVPLSFIRHRTSTCGLSNRWSPCGLTRLTRWGTSSRGELRT